MRSRSDALERWLVRLEAGDDLSELERQGTSRTGALARELAIANIHPDREPPRSHRNEESSCQTARYRS